MILSSVFNINIFTFFVCNEHIILYDNAIELALS